MRENKIIFKVFPSCRFMFPFFSSRLLLFHIFFIILSEINSAFGRTTNNKNYRFSCQKFYLGRKLKPKVSCNSNTHTFARHVPGDNRKFSDFSSYCEKSIFHLHKGLIVVTLFLINFSIFNLFTSSSSFHVLKILRIL